MPVTKLPLACSIAPTLSQRRKASRRLDAIKGQKHAFFWSSNERKIMMTDTCTRCVVSHIQRIGSQLAKKTVVAGRPGSSEVSRNPLTRWDVSLIPANGIFLTKKQKNKNKKAQRVEND